MVSHVHSHIIPHLDIHDPGCSLQLAQFKPAYTWFMKVQYYPQLNPKPQYQTIKLGHTVSPCPLNVGVQDLVAE